MVHSEPQEKPSRFSRLALKIIAAISMSVLLIQLAFTSYIEKNLYQAELSKLVDQQVRFTEANAIYIAELVSDENEDSLYLILSSIVANPLIVGAELKYSDGRSPLYVGDDPTPLAYGFEINDLDDNDELVSVGRLSTYATTSFIDDSRSSRTAGILILILLVFLVVLAVSTMAVQGFIGIPLRRITSALVSGKRVPMIQWETRDEMGTVVKRLNYLHTTLNNQLTGLEQELSDSERREAARITSLANATLEGILIFKDDRIIDLNEPMAQLLPGIRESLIDGSITALLPADVLGFLDQPLRADQRPVISTVFIDADGSETPVEVYLNQLEDHGAGNRVAVVRDVSERVNAEKAMWRLAHYDSLTELPNRRYFSELLDKAIVNASANQQTLSVAYLDLDNFKFINDSRGHSVGDQLLCGVAQSLQSTLGGSDKCTRLGGDEFAILFEEDDLDEPLELVLKRVLSGILDGPYCEPWREVFSVSIGVATMPGSSVDKDEILARADLALYKAKASGRARICDFSEHLDEELKRERLIIERLVHALEQNLLELYFQPQVTCSNSVVTGFEALLRWHDVELGWVSPEEIIRIAEREGIVSQLGRWVVRRACHAAAEWPDDIRVAVNLSPLELVDNSLPSFIISCLEEAGLPATRLEVEITETALVADAGKAAELLGTLKDMGVLIALDDFGTGYSSLSMLQSFPFDRIKIDRSFVSNLSEDTSKASIVTTIIDLGARLNLNVIAEGVETEADIATLQKFNCHECQGYLISRPVPSDQLQNIIDRYSAAAAGSVVTLDTWQKAG